MPQVDAGSTFEEWVEQCRVLVASNTNPDAVRWTDSASEAPQMEFTLEAQEELHETVSAPRFTVPREFKELARTVYHHRSPDRFHLLYAALWRIVHGERNLLEKLTDPIVHPLFVMRKQVTRDAHKMKAFVRFRRVERDGVEWYVAWHRPDHFIVRYIAPFFRDRFNNMNWSILTPDESVHWNQQQLEFGLGVARDPIQNDRVEELWRTYYASVFNPARLKIKAMKTEMPMRYWKTMPETAIIPGLVAASQDRTAAMLETHEQSAADYLPPEPRTVEALRQAAQVCRGCPLYHGCTHAVVSEGPAKARIVLVGEQPGNEEDKSGRPFVGPAGKMLDKALADAGLERLMIYITEAIKHFKHDSRHGRRFHRTPSASDVAACRPWLQAEMALVKPEVIVCLGTTAAHSVIGKKITLKSVRGQVLETPMSSKTLVTTHPSAVLRHPDRVARAAAYDLLVSDLKRAAALAAK